MPFVPDIPSFTYTESEIWSLSKQKWLGREASNGA